MNLVNSTSCMVQQPSGGMLRPTNHSPSVGIFLHGAAAVWRCDPPITAPQ
jgi:hypothetical protein